MEPKPTKTDVTVFNLAEARKQIETLQKKIQEGNADSEELKFDFAEAVWHIYAAWNTIGLDFSDIEKMSKEKFKRLGTPCSKLNSSFD